MNWRCWLGWHAWGDVRETTLGTKVRVQWCACERPGCKVWALIVGGQRVEEKKP